MPEGTTLFEKVATESTPTEYFERCREAGCAVSDTKSPRDTYVSREIHRILYYSLMNIYQYTPPLPNE